MKRFNKYIQEVEKTTTCEQFLDDNRNFIAQTEKNEKFLNDLKIHKALSNMNRYMILKLLEHRPMCTCALAKVFSVSDGTITHHLKILEKAGLIIGKKEGYFTKYYTKKLMIDQITQMSLAL
jgi:DNA-binding transcriptional ArsR family regulator